MKKAKPENTIRLLTLNIHKGFPIFGKKVTLQELKVHIQNVKADLVCLQEVIGLNNESPVSSQFEFLADEIWTHYAYGKNAVHSQGHHGNAILSHYPFTHQSNTDISNHRFEQRGILYGVVNLSKRNDHNLHIMTLHLDLSSWGRMRQVEKLCLLIKAEVPPDAPLIVCGDFNDWREQLTDILLKRAGMNEVFLQQYNAHARTFPAYLPLLKLDRIYVRNLEVKSAQRLDWHHLSDHLALLCDLQF
jgi:endonuclease/exonuclease/phosphatase family metal-dependent hydrolase